MNVFTAKYDSECWECGRATHPGDRVAYVAHARSVVCGLCVDLYLEEDAASEAAQEAEHNAR